MNIKSVDYISMNRKTYNENLEKFPSVSICLDDELEDGIIMIYYHKGLFNAITYVDDLGDVLK